MRYFQVRGATPPPTPRNRCAHPGACPPLTKSPLTKPPLTKTNVYTTFTSSAYRPSESPRKSKQLVGCRGRANRYNVALTLPCRGQRPVPAHVRVVQRGVEGKVDVLGRHGSLRRSLASIHFRRRDENPVRRAESRR